MTKQAILDLLHDMAGFLATLIFFLGVIAVCYGIGK